MGESLRGWRRKFGVVTLLMACLFAAGWVRSVEKYDFIGISCGGSCYRLASRFEMMTLLRETPFYGSSGWYSGDLTTVTGWTDRDGNLHSFSGCNVEWRHDFGEIVLGAATMKQGRKQRLVSCTFPYWYITLPLTVLSAYLLLSKPRATCPIKITEPVPEKIE